ncbi:hypothetical protein L6452_37764 [Arctium lappa]|uniref:Uncharacterized protein n=1 Tax=Arctium lappa TaxID=4217 RepID=A0ACB8Y4E7_ARCLA|nr:hypothetical protein L6452_37764 [Arctium lappa]
MTKCLCEGLILATQNSTISDHGGLNLNLNFLLGGITNHRSSQEDVTSVSDEVLHIFCDEVCKEGPSIAVWVIKISRFFRSNSSTIVDEFWWVSMVTAGSNNQDDVGEKPSSVVLKAGGGARQSCDTTGSGQSTSGSVGSPSTQSELAMVGTPVSESTFLRLNHLDIHTDNAGSQGAVGLRIESFASMAHRWRQWMKVNKKQETVQLQLRMQGIEPGLSVMNSPGDYRYTTRLLTVNKYAPRGSQPERRVIWTSFKIYVGNMAWQMDNNRRC